MLKKIKNLFSNLLEKNFSLSSVIANGHLSPALSISPFMYSSLLIKKKFQKGLSSNVSSRVNWWQLSMATNVT